MNQGKTLKEELNGGFIWAPLKDKGGGVKYYWDNLQKLKIDDIVLHYSEGFLHYVSRVLKPAVQSKKPVGISNKKWQEDGRLVRVEYHELNPKISIKNISSKINKLNIKNSPINNVNGVKEGYLFNLANEALKIIINSQPGTKWTDFVPKINGEIAKPFAKMKNLFVLTLETGLHFIFLKKVEKIIGWEWQLKIKGKNLTMYIFGNLLKNVKKILEL